MRHRCRSRLVGGARHVGLALDAEKTIARRAGRAQGPRARWPEKTGDWRAEAMPSGRPKEGRWPGRADAERMGEARSANQGAEAPEASPAGIVDQCSQQVKRSRRVWRRSMAAAVRRAGGRRRSRSFAACSTGLAPRKLLTRASAQVSDASSDRYFSAASRVRTPGKKSTRHSVDHSPLSREFSPNLRCRIVGSEPHKGGAALLPGGCSAVSLRFDATTPKRTVRTASCTSRLAVDHIRTAPSLALDTCAAYSARTPSL